MIKIKASVPQFNENWWGSSKNQLAEVLQQDNELSWMQERDPQTGKGWAPLTAKYRSWKNRFAPGQPILRLSGKMLNTTRIRPGSAIGLFSARTRVDYGSYHMTGTSKMPARPWLGVPSITVPKMESIVAKAIAKGRNVRI
jgi:phage gpG-like protein